LPLLFCNAGLGPSDRGQDAHDTQGRDALATQKIGWQRQAKFSEIAAANPSLQTCLRHV
jgi:hypothetical protein